MSDYHNSCFNFSDSCCGMAAMSFLLSAVRESFPSLGTLMKNLVRGFFSEPCPLFYRLFLLLQPLLIYVIVTIHVPKTKKSASTDQLREANRSVR